MREYGTRGAGKKYRSGVNDGEFRILIRGLIRIYIVENFENNYGSIPREFWVAHRTGDRNRFWKILK